MKLGAYDYLLKPVDIANLRGMMTKALHLRRLTGQVDPPALPESTQDTPLLGQSAAMQDLYKMIGRVAPTDMTVLISGESGTGKELVARAIHQHSLRADGPWVALNCAAIPEALLESELFGHEKGAFTGATERKPGSFEEASGGSMFLGEAGELPLAVQAKLLRALQEREIRTHYRRAKDPVARSHWQVIWLLAQELTSAQVAAVTDDPVSWIRTVVRRYKQQGPAGLEDRRHRTPGATGMLSTAQRVALAAALQRPPPDGGVWAGPKAAAWMAVALSRRVHAQRGGEAWRLGRTAKMPRPRHAKPDTTAQAAFKKPPGCSAQPAAGLPPAGGGVVGHRPIPHREEAYPAPRLKPTWPARARWCSTAIRGATSTHLCSRRQVELGGCCSPPCPLPPLCSPSSSLPKRSAPDKANRSSSYWIARDGM